jgi:hypothetical protein
MLEVVKSGVVSARLEDLSAVLDYLCANNGASNILRNLADYLLTDRASCFTRLKSTVVKYFIEVLLIAWVGQNLIS